MRSQQMRVSPQQYHRMINSNPENVNCKRCGIKINIGEEIYTRKTVLKAKWYHIECARKVNLL